jgi:hypothetical protein
MRWAISDLCLQKKKRSPLSYTPVGIREVEDQSWLVSFMDYDLGYFDNERGRQ